MGNLPFKHESCLISRHWQINSHPRNYRLRGEGKKYLQHFLLAKLLGLGIIENYQQNQQIPHHALPFNCIEESQGR